MAQSIRLMWSSVREPRHIKTIYLVFYWVAIVFGLMTFIQPPDLVLHEIGRILTMGFSAFLFLGGAAGALAVFPGWWWLERLGNFSLILACVEFIIVVIYQASSSTGAQVVIGLFAIGFFLIRLCMIWKYSFEPRGERVSV